MQGTATRLLNKFKQGEIKLRRTSQAVASNPWNPISASSSDYDLFAAVEPVSKGYIDNQTITADDRMVIFNVIEFEPDIGDLIIIDGKAFEMKRLRRYPQAGTPVYYEAIICA